MPFANITTFNDMASYYDAQGGYSLNGGVKRPKEGTLGPGTRLVRFAGPGCNSNAKPNTIRPGRWWLLERHYFQIANEARAYGVSIPWMVREQCAILCEWSNMTVRITAVTRKPLLCYRGRGAPVSNKGRLEYDARMADEMGIEQLFIPGLDKPSFCDTALETVSVEYISSQDSLMPFLPSNPVR